MAASFQTAFRDALEGVFLPIARDCRLPEGTSVAPAKCRVISRTNPPLTSAKACVQACVICRHNNDAIARTSSGDGLRASKTYTREYVGV